MSLLLDTGTSLASSELVVVARFSRKYFVELLPHTKR